MTRPIESLMFIVVVLFIIQIIGVFAHWTGTLYASVPWIAFACWATAYGYNYYRRGNAA